MAQGAGEGAGFEGEHELSQMTDALRDLGAEAREAVERLVAEWEIDRRMREDPYTVLGIAAAAGFVLGGGLWPLVRPFARAALRSALSPGNLLAIGAALGAARVARGREEATSAPAGAPH